MLSWTTLQTHTITSWQSIHRNSDQQFLRNPLPIRHKHVWIRSNLIIQLLHTPVSTCRDNRTSRIEERAPADGSCKKLNRRSERLLPFIWFQLSWLTSKHSRIILHFCPVQFGIHVEVCGHRVCQIGPGPNKLHFLYTRRRILFRITLEKTFFRKSPAVMLFP